MVHEKTTQTSAVLYGQKNIDIVLDCQHLDEDAALCRVDKL